MFNLVEEMPEQWDTRFSMLEFYCIRIPFGKSHIEGYSISWHRHSITACHSEEHILSWSPHLWPHVRHSTCDQCGFWLWTFIAAQCSPPPFTMKPYPPQGTSNLGLFTFSTWKASCNNLFQHLSTRTMYQNICCIVPSNNYHDTNMYRMGWTTIPSFWGNKTAYFQGVVNSLFASGNVQIH